MKNTTMFSRLGAMMIIALLISSVQYGVAAGTTAGTAITNSATVSYMDGVNLKNKTSNTVTMYVGHKVAGAFSPASGSTNTYDNVTYYHAINFQNSSNRLTKYTMSFNSVAGYTLSLIRDDNQDGVHQPGETTVVTTDSLVIDGSKYYFIKAVVGTIANGTSNGITVTFTNASGDSTNTVVVNPAASFSYTLTSTIVKPVISYQVSGTAPSPLIPGAPFDFTVSLDNTGTATPYSYDLGASDSSVVQIQYTVPSNFEFTGGASGAFTLSPSGYVSYTYSGGIITMLVDTSYLEPADASISFTLPIRIDQTTNSGTGPASGSSITSAAGDFSVLTYSSPQTQLTTTASTSGTIFTGSTTVAASKGGMWSVTPANDSTAANETNEYILTLKNMGNTSATFTITDTDNGGNVVVNHLVAESSYGTDLAGSTASVAAGSTIQIYVRLTVPGTAVAQDSIKRKLAVASDAAGTLYTGAVVSDYEHTIVTYVVAASFNITLAAESVAGIGTTTNPAPEDTVTFALTLANTGTTNITSVQISNLIPANMTFLANAYAAGQGIRIDAVNQSNANDGDDAYFDGSAVKTNSTFSINAEIGRAHV